LQILEQRLLFAGEAAGEAAEVAYENVAQVNLDEALDEAEESVVEAKVSAVQAVFDAKRAALEATRVALKR